MEKRAIAKGFGWNLLFTLINRIVFPIASIAVARMLGPDQLGVFTAVLSVLSVAEIFREGGLGVTYITDSKMNRDREGAYVSLSVLMSAILALTLFLSRGAIERYFGFDGMAEALGVASIVILINGLGLVPANKLSRDAKFKELGSIDLASNVISYAILFAALALGAGFMVLVWQLAIRTVLSVSVNLYFVKPAWPRKLGVSDLSILKSSYVAMLNNIQYTIYTTADYAVIAKLFGKTATGHYGVAYNLASKPFEFITAPLNRALMPAFMALQDDRPKLANRFVRAIAAVCLVAVPVYGCLAIYARPTILLLYTESFAASIPLFTVLCGYLFARSLGPIAGNVLYVSGKAKVNVWTWCLGYAVVASGFLFFGASHSVISATVWISLGAVAAYGSCLALALKFLGPQSKDYFLLLKATVIGSGSIAVGAMASFLPLESWIQLLLGLGLTAVTQLVLVGKFYGTGYRSALSRSGLKAIFQKL